MRQALSRLWALTPYVVAAAAVSHYLRGVITEMVTTRPEIVDFGVYFRAAQAFASGHHLYQPFSGCCFDSSAMDGYTYPPTLAVALSPLSGLPVGVAGRLFLGASQLSLLGALVLMHLTVRSMVGRRTEAWLLAAVVLFQPIHAGNFGLQVSNMLLLLFAIAAWSYVHQRGGPLGGMAVGLGAALKVAPAQMIVPLLADRPRRAALSIAGFGIAAVVPLLLVWTVAPETPSYFTDVLQRFSGGVSSPYNRSLAGVVLRTYSALGAAPPAALATLFHGIELAGIGATWLWCRRSAGTPAGRAATFAAFLAIMPVTQPVTWDHHMVADALAFVLMAPMLHPRRLAWWAAVAGMAVMCVNQLELGSILQRAGFDPPHGGAGVVVYVAAASVNLVGMLLLYGAALSVARAHRAQPTAAVSLVGRRRPPAVLRPAHASTRSSVPPP